MTTEEKIPAPTLVAVPSAETALVQPQATGLLAMIERIAMNPNADIEKMKALMLMRNEELAAVRKQEYAQDLIPMKPELPLVIKKKFNSQTKSNYAPLDEINETVDPILAKYGFATTMKVIAQTVDSVTVRAELWHKGGHIEATEVTMPIDNKGIQGTVNKTGPHATKSSITYARNAALCALLNISMKNEDDDGNGAGEDVTPATEPQREAIKKLLMNATEKAKEQFTEKYGTVNEVKKTQVDVLIQWLNKHQQKGDK